MLGGFDLVQDGTAIDVSKRITRKPLELLKAIIALGGREIAPAALADLLWPDAEGDAAQKALETTLHRLRKQLGSEHALPVHQGKIGIDPQHCWVDLVALNGLVAELEKSLRSEASLEALRSLADALENLYRGDLLPRETDLPWLSAPRQRLHARFLDLVAALGQALEQAGDVERAISLYLRGTHVESTVEPLYQRLIACYLRTGRVALAEEAYRRCLAALSAQSGKRPSAETEFLGQDSRLLPALKSPFSRAIRPGSVRRVGWHVGNLWAPRLARSRLDAMCGRTAATPVGAGVGALWAPCP